MLDLSNVEAIEICTIVEWSSYAEDEQNYEIFASLEEARKFANSLGEDFYYRINFRVYVREFDGELTWLLDTDSMDTAETVAAGLRLLLQAEQQK